MRDGTDQGGELRRRVGTVRGLWEGMGRTGFVWSGGVRTKGDGIVVLKHAKGYCKECGNNVFCRSLGDRLGSDG